MDIKKILFKTNTIDVEKALPDSVIFISKDGRIQWVNDKTAEVFETSKMHLLTSNIIDFIENALNMISNSVKNENIVITKLISKEIYLEMNAKEIEEGFVLSFRNAVSRDAIVTGIGVEKVVDKDKNTFLLKLSNDLKSPLQSIVGFSQAMADGLGGEMSEQQEKYIKIIRKNSSYLMYFIGKILDLSESESNKKSAEYRTFDVINAVNSVVKFNEQLYKGKDLAWKTNVEEGVKTPIYTDEKIFKAIIQNILEVVLKSVDMGEININLSSPDEEFIRSKNLPMTDYVQITVSSSALLLSENDLECMFDPYKIIDTSNRKNILRAMTLACVKNDIQALNGMVWVESTILKNTSFNIMLPVGRN